MDGAIHRTAGPQLLAECRGLGRCDTGDAKVTLGYNLPAKWVIHTVGPIWSGGDANEDALLARCYRRCFGLAEERKLKSIAFPAISAGAYGFPLERATGIAVTEVTGLLVRATSLERVTFVCFNERAYQVYLKALAGE